MDIERLIRGKATSTAATLDDVEQASAGGEAGLDALLALYAAYDASSAVELFPPALEAAALLHILRADQSDKDALVRIGRLSAELLPAVSVPLRAATPVEATPEAAEAAA